MKIAFTHNLKVGSSEEAAEFDTPETISRITEALKRLGHEVHLVEVSGSAIRLMARLEALGPDLVFNTAEGIKGTYREAFYPALFDQLGVPFTGSDAYTCALTLDKQASKVLVADAGVKVARGVFVDEWSGYERPELGYPVIVKPNFEGSSKGISQDAIVDSPEALDAYVAKALERYPSGLVIEEFIVGRDVTVPFLEACDNGHGGVLSSALYHFDPEATADDRYKIYDYKLKNELSDAVHVIVPSGLGDALEARLREAASRVIHVLGVRDLGRVDFRLGDDGELYFIEVNALPSLEPGASIYESAALAGLDSVEAVLECVVKSACTRQGVVERTQHRHEGSMRVGLAFNLKRQSTAGGDDAEAEYDSPKTIASLRGAIESMGHEVIELEATAELLSILPGIDVDVVFNIAEGLKGRNREAQVPAMLELLGISYTGSDPAALSLTLDKALAKRLVRQAGLLTPDFVLMTRGDEPLPAGMKFPLIVKPNTEGSSKGVSSASVVRDERALREQVQRLTQRYHQGALVEAFLPGREFTVALLGEVAPRVLPPMEIVFSESAGELPVYSYEHKQETDMSVRYEVPARVDAQLAEEISRTALGAFEALGCRDVARMDLRLDEHGRVHFIECNPLPGMTPDYSDLCLIAKGAGLDYVSLIGEIMAPAMRRFHLMRQGGQ